jgi:hypothetical protein
LALLVPVMALAQRAGLGDLVREHVRPGAECGVNAPVKIGCLVAALADQIGFELGDHGEDLQEHPGERVVPVVDRPAEHEADAAGGKLPEDVQRVGHRAGEPVQLGDGQGVALADGGQGLVEAGPGAAGAGEFLVDVDAVGCNAELSAVSCSIWMSASCSSVEQRA